MTSALIVGAAPAPGAAAFYRRLLTKAEIVMAADAAGEWSVRLGRVPELTIGDFDSAEPGAQERLRHAGCRVVEIPAEKDFSDLDACLAEARRTLGVDSVTFSAAFSGRVDHTLAAFGSVLRAADLSGTIEEPGWRAWVLDAAARPHLSLGLPEGSIVSVMSPGGAGGVSIKGAEYELQGADLEPLSSLGLSNLTTKRPLEVSVDRGAALVIVQEG